jgi:hypothetical protein
MERRLALCIGVALLTLQCAEAFAEPVAPSAATTEAPKLPKTCLNDPDPTIRCHKAVKEVRTITPTANIKGAAMTDFLTQTKPAKKEQDDSILSIPANE